MKTPTRVDLDTPTGLWLMQLVAAGLSDAEIAGHLRLSASTVGRHVGRLRRRVGARNRVELAAWAGQQGLYRRRPGAANRPAGPRRDDAPPAAG